MSLTAGSKLEDSRLAHEGEDGDVLVAVESLARVQDRFESENSDGGSTGRSDGGGGDGKNDTYE
jgi:hypothetical protein